MSHIHVKFKKLSRAALPPVKADSGSAGWDLHVANMQPIRKEGNFYTRIIETGLATEFPDQWVMCIVPRSGSGFNHQVKIANSMAVIDSSFRGETKIKLVTPTESGKQWLEELRTGDRFAQALFLPVPAVSWEEADELSGSDRGDGAFGSSGK